MKITQIKDGDIFGDTTNKDSVSQEQSTKLNNFQAKIMGRKMIV